MNNDIPSWLTLAAGTFAAIFALLSLWSSGADGQFWLFVVIAAVFFLSSLMKDAWLRTALTWIGSLFRGG